MDIDAADELQLLGSDYDDCMRSRENDAVTIFGASWERLSERLGKTLRA